MIRRTKPLARSTKPIPRKRSKPRRGPMRDRGYLDFLRSECRCAVCGTFRSIEAAHGPVNGMRSKGPDNEALPLCTFHHRMQHAEGREAFCSRYSFNWQRYAAAQYAVYLIWKEAQCQSG